MLERWVLRRDYALTVEVFYFIFSRGILLLYTHNCVSLKFYKKMCILEV